MSGGETVTCTFHDAREKGAIVITKTRKHAADGPGDHPQANVTFKVYPNLNHVLQEGTGVSTPAEYEKLGGPSPKFIADVAAWLLAK